MGCRTTATLFPRWRSSPVIAREVGLFPQPVRTAQTETTGFVDSIMVEDAPSRRKSAPEALTRDALCMTSTCATSLYANTTSSTWWRRISAAAPTRRRSGCPPDRVGPQVQEGMSACNSRDLKSGECLDVVAGIVPEMDIEVVKVPPGGPMMTTLFVSLIRLLQSPEVPGSCSVRRFVFPCVSATYGDVRVSSPASILSRERPSRGYSPDPR